MCQGGVLSLRKKLLDTFGAQVSSDHERYPADVKCLGFLYLYVGRYPRNNASRNKGPPRSTASVSRCCSISSRNLRNMTQVRMGRRSRSPERPLSLRMIWRADLMMPASCWAVVGGGGRGLGCGFFLGHYSFLFLRWHINGLFLSGPGRQYGYTHPQTGFA